jgi:hypothetical protein
MLAQFAIQARLIFRQLWPFLRSHKKLGLISFIIITSAIITSWFVFAPFAQAGLLSDVGETIGKAFAELLFLLAGFCIKLTFFVLKFIIEVAGYNGFIDSPAVTVGWVMIRDLTNMFFVVVLLMIAFGTILGLDHYEWKHMLVKLVTAAVLVNFSRLICGLIIDVAQIVMVTFLNGIAATASGNLVNMFQVDKIFKLGNGENFTGDTPSIFLASVAAIMFSVTMLITMVAFLFIIVARMAMLWVLIVVSPFAFVLNVLHQTEHFAGEWWGKFNSNVVSGPVIAFFLWLSFVTVGSGNIHDDIVKHNSLKQGQLLQESAAPAEEQTGITEVMSWENMGNFIIAIAILMAGAKMAEELGVAGAHMMGSASELGKKVAMYASGFQAAKWAGGKVGEGAKAAGKFAVMKMPLIGGEAWQRRGHNIKSRAAGWYYDKLAKSTVKAGEISKTFAVNDKGQYVKKVALRDEQGNIIKDEHGNTEYKEVEQRGLGDWAKRTFARARLEWGIGYGAFHKAYSEDLEATAEAKHEQLDHLASTSSLPIGMKKQKAKEWLHFLEHTGADIKAGKEANMELLREKIMHALERGEENGKSEEEVDKELRELGLDDMEIFKARQGFGRFNKSMKAKAEAKVKKEYVGEEHKKQEVEKLEKYLHGKEGKKLQGKSAEVRAETKRIEDELAAKKQIEELESIKELLKQGLEVTEPAKSKAMAEQLNFDVKELQDLQIARARDKVLRDNHRSSEANNEQNTINNQVEERIKKHNAAGDYVQSDAKTTAQLARIEAQKKIIANAKNEESKKAAEAVLRILERSLSEMQISNLGTHAAVADGIKSKILEAVGMSTTQSMELTPQAIRNLQAQDIAELINEKVDASSHASLEKALERLNEIYGDKASAMLEQKRLKNEKAAGQGSLGRAGLYKIDSATLKTVLVDADNKSDIEYVAGRRKNGLSGSKLTNVIGFAGSMDRGVDGKLVVKSEDSKDIFVKLAVGLTGNNLGNVEEFTKGDIGAIFDNSSVADLQDLLGRLEKQVPDQRAVQALLKFALETGRMKNTDNIKEVEEALKRIE